MINLIPLHTKDLSYLWELISERNKWFIKLRYIAVVMLLGLYVFIIFFGSENIQTAQKTGILLILTSILIYNLFFSYISSTEIIKNNAASFNPLKFALIQIVFDTSILMLIVYLTGLINSPFYLFFIFHAIIGSLILPGRVVYFIAALILTVFTALNLLTHYDIIAGFTISNTVPVNLLNTNYLLLNLLSFWLMIFFSVFIVNLLTSELYRREQELIEAIQKIEDAEIEKQKYILTVVHEVKSPLSVIVSYLNLLIEGIPDKVSDKVKDILLKMKKRSDDAIELTKNILEVSKVKQIKKPDLQIIDPDLMIRDMLDIIKDQAEAEKITIHYTDNRVQRNILYADKNLMGILFSNIFNNAVKYNHSGGRVDILLSDRSNDLCISVADTGIGIPSDELGKISTEFYRAKNAKKNREGTGLGLYAVSQVVKKHNGKLHIKSPSETGDSLYPGTSIAILIPYGLNDSDNA
ncbi:MAG: HAMP domain-containing sensor histidine kinase [Ignavibacteria bacterium]